MSVYLEGCVALVKETEISMTLFHLSESGTEKEKEIYTEGG